MGAVAWTLELIGIYVEIRKKQYINSTQKWQPVWGFTHLMQISAYQIQISLLINTDIPKITDIFNWNADICNWNRDVSNWNVNIGIWSTYISICNHNIDICISIRDIYMSNTDNCISIKDISN